MSAGDKIPRVAFTFVITPSHPRRGVDVSITGFCVTKRSSICTVNEFLNVLASSRSLSRSGCALPAAAPGNVSSTCSLSPPNVPALHPKSRAMAAKPGSPTLSEADLALHPPPGSQTQWVLRAGLQGEVTYPE